MFAPRATAASEDMNMLHVTLWKCVQGGCQSTVQRVCPQTAGGLRVQRAQKQNKQKKLCYKHVLLSTFKTSVENQRD